MSFFFFVTSFACFCSCYFLVVLHEAVSFVIEAQVHLAHAAEYVGADDVALLTAELAGLPVDKQWGMEEGQIKPYCIVWFVAEVPSDGWGEVHTGAGKDVGARRFHTFFCWAKNGWLFTCSTPEHLQPKVLQGHPSLLQCLAVTAVEEPGIDETKVDDVGKQPHVPPFSLHWCFVQVNQHVTFVYPPHVGIIALDYIWAGHIFFLLCVTAVPLAFCHRLHPQVSREHRHSLVVFPS